MRCEVIGAVVGATDVLGMMDDVTRRGDKNPFLIERQDI